MYCPKPSKVFSIVSIMGRTKIVKMNSAIRLSIILLCSNKNCLLKLTGIAIKLSSLFKLFYFYSKRCWDNHWWTENAFFFSLNVKIYCFIILNNNIHSSIQRGEIERQRENILILLNILFVQLFISQVCREKCFCMLFKLVNICFNSSLYISTILHQYQNIFSQESYGFRDRSLGN